MNTDDTTLPAADREVDARGLNCPLPILKAKKALADMDSGQVLKVRATDPGSLRDFQAFSRQTGNAHRHHQCRSRSRGLVRTRRSAL